MKIIFKLLVLGISALAFQVDADTPKQQTYTLSIEAQPLDGALNKLALQSGWQLAFYPEVCAGYDAPQLEGVYTLQAALSQLLKNTPLRYQLLNNNHLVAIRASAEVEAAAQARRKALSTSHNLQESGPALLLAQVQSAESRPGAASKTRSDDSGRNGNASRPLSSDRAPQQSMADPEGEIIVTGTQIRGKAPIGSPLMVFTETDFDKAGAATAEQFLQTLPQNFASRTQYTTAGGAPGVENHDVQATTVDLRGLGAGSTLVLVNGRRLARSPTPLGSSTKGYTDISMIPLSAVERVEILLDGASSSYGSDAIGGVVNFIMKKNYQGADTRLRMGTTTRGGGEEIQFGQTFGAGWGTGNALLSYEYHEQKALTLEDRPFAFDSTVFGFVPTLTSPQDSNSAGLFLHQDLSERIALRSDLSFSQRKGEAVRGSLTELTFVDRYKVRQYSVNLGGTLEINDRWTADLDVGGSRNENTFNYAVNDPGLLFEARVGDSESNLRNVDVVLNGELWQLSAGMLKMAVGGSYRSESLDLQSATADFPEFPAFNELDSKVRAAFAEFTIPLVASLDAQSSLPRLELSLAGRYDDYDTFGDSTNPKVGIRWIAVPGVHLRASYSTSFRAPDPTELDPTQEGYRLATATPEEAAFLPGGATTFLIHQGSNPHLGSETSRTWTAGVDFTPETLPGFRASLTASDIRYEDRIAGSGATNETILSNSAFSSLALLRGSIPSSDFNSLIASIVSGQGTVIPRRIGGCPDGAPFPRPLNCNLTAGELASIGAVVEQTLRNLNITHNRVLDLALSQRINADVGGFDFDLNATWIFDYEQQVISGSPTLDFVNTTFNPPRLRFRAGAGFNRGGFSTNAFLNFVNKYSNTTLTPSEDVASWSTVDLNLRYEVPSGFSEWLQGTAVSFNAINVFDRAPPHVESYLTPTFGWRYDPTNANPYGRVVSLALTKSW